MKKIQKFFDTLCIFTGNLLRLKPTSWKAAEKTAESMRSVAQMDLFNQGENGEKVSPQTPLTYLADSVLNLLALAAGIWIISKIVAGFIALLPYLIGIAFVMWLISMFLPPKGNAVAS